MTNPYDPNSGFTPPPGGVQDPYAYQQPGGFQPVDPYQPADPYQQAQPYGAGYGVAPQNNMGWGIAGCVVGAIAFFSCCLGVIPLVFGILAAVKAGGVNSSWTAGDLVGAQTAADEAKKFGMIAAIGGGVMIALGIVLMVVYFVFLATAGV